jgi:hypothetical protein
MEEVMSAMSTKRVIWKFSVTPGDFSHRMPAGPVQYLAVQMQDGEPVLWALVPESATGTWEHRFRVVPTGAPFDDTGLHYIGTFQREGLVFHLFFVEIS